MSKKKDKKRATRYELVTLTIEAVTAVAALIAAIKS